MRDKKKLILRLLISLSFMLLWLNYAKAQGDCGSLSTQDFSVAYIKRLPSIDYVQGSNNPAVDGWPAVNQQVQWRAYVLNHSSINAYDIPYEFLMDGIVVQSGMLNIPAQGRAFAEYQWSWTFTRHELIFRLDPNNTIAEWSERNNSLQIFTNALSMNIYIEQPLYHHFHQHQCELGAGTNGFEDWLQILHISKWNKMFADAIFPETPEGVTDRIRLDSVIIVPQGYLPLVDGYYPTICPNGDDRSVDLQWGFTADLIAGYNNYTDTTGDNPFFFEGSLLHELGHARYLIDTYAFDIHDDGTGSTIMIKENGVSIVNSDYMEMQGQDAVYYTAFSGLMASDYTKIDRFSAAMLNRIAGHRATYGNCNAPGNFGEYVNELPANNIMTLKDAQGNPLSHADVKIFRNYYLGGYYPKLVDDAADLEFTADDSGKFNMGKCPFQEPPLNVTGAEGIMLIRVETGTKIGYEFFESGWFTLEYYKGNTQWAEYELTFDHLVSKTISSSDGRQSSVEAVAYPNPFSAQIQLLFNLEQRSLIEMEICSLEGMKLVHKAPVWYEAGTHTLAFNGERLPHGMLLLKMRSGEATQVFKICRE